LTSARPTFEEQFWPIVVALVVLAAFLMGVAAAFLRFDDPRWGRNAWLVLGAIPLLTLIVAALLYRLGRRHMGRATQLALVLSVVVHLVLLLVAMWIQIGSRPWTRMLADNTPPRQRPEERPVRPRVMARTVPPRPTQPPVETPSAEPAAVAADRQQERAASPERAQELPVVEPSPTPLVNMVRREQPSEATPRFDEQQSRLSRRASEQEITRSTRVLAASDTTRRTPTTAAGPEAKAQEVARRPASSAERVAAAVAATPDQPEVTMQPSRGERQPELPAVSDAANVPRRRQAAAAPQTLASAESLPAAAANQPDSESLAAAELAATVATTESIQATTEWAQTVAEAASAAATAAVTAQIADELVNGGLVVELGNLEGLATSLGRIGLAPDLARVLKSDLDSPLRIVLEADEYLLPEGVELDQTLILVETDGVLAGTVTGNVLVAEGSLLITPTGRVEGEVVAIDADIQNQGTVIGGLREAGHVAPVVVAPMPPRIRIRGGQPPFVSNLWRGVGSLARTIAMYLLFGFLGAIIVYFFRNQLETVSDTVSYSFGRSFLAGLAAEILFLPIGLVLTVLIVTAIAVPFYALGFALLGLLGAGPKSDKQWRAMEPVPRIVHGAN
jgi:hypothetical protein